MGGWRATVLAAVMGSGAALLAAGGLEWSGRPAGAARPERVELIRTRNLPDIGLTDHDGRRVRFYSDLVQGKVVVISFMYASCSRTCALAGQSLARVQEQLAGQHARRIAFYSISLDPEHDTPQVLADYRRAMGAGPGWTFLTADTLADVTALRHRLGLREPDPVLDADLTSHANLIVIGNEPAGRWSKVPALVDPVRILQAIDRVVLPPDRWQHGTAMVNAVPREIRDGESRR